jgi:hypothetical protein
LSKVQELQYKVVPPRRLVLGFALRIKSRVKIRVKFGVDFQDQKVIGYRMHGQKPLKIYSIPRVNCGVRFPIEMRVKI